MSSKVLVALVGQPNCGKSTVFNMLTGARQHVANYPGVTVEKKTGAYSYAGRHVELVDLPGTYALTSFSLVALRKKEPDLERPYKIPGGIGMGSAVLGVAQFGLAGVVSPLVNIGSETTAVPLAVVMIAASLIANIALWAAGGMRQEAIAAPEAEPVAVGASR